jgi:hypothetical protein
MAPQFGLYSNKAFLRAHDVNRLIQYVVFLADCVFLPASIVPEPTASVAEKKYILSRLNELHSICACKFWDIEGQYSFLRAISARAGNELPIDRIITQNEYRSIYEDVLSKVNSM